MGVIAFYIFSRAENRRENRRGVVLMKKHLQLILSLLCVLALVFGLSAALAEEEKDARVITIKWVDENNYDKLRPDHLDVMLAGETTVLNEANGWTGEVSVPISTGNDWEYSRPEGYGASIDKGPVSVLTLQHTVAPLVDKTASIEWDDNSNEKGIRPSYVTLMLYADGAPCREPQSGLAAVTWEDVPPFTIGGTVPIDYSVKPVQVPAGYTAECSGMHVTFKLQTVNVSVSVSVSGAPEGTDLSSLRLVLDGPEPGLPKTLTYADVADGYTLTGVLPGAYLIRDINADTLVEGYTMDTENSKVCDAVYIAYNPEGQASGTLNWKYTYKEPEAIEDLDTEYDPWENVGNLTFEILGPDENLPMTVTFAQFDSNNQYQLKGLKPGVYTVVERNAEKLVKYYTLTSDSDTALKLEVTPDGKTAKALLTNIYVPAPTPEPDAEFVDIPVTKTWNDNNDKDGNRPDSITVRLYADGVEVDSHVLTAAEKWKYTFTDKPRYQEDNRTEIVYSVNEDAVKMYSKEINGYNLVNYYLPEVTSRSVAKVWEDNNDEQKLRPSSIVMTLLNNKGDTVATVVLNKGNNWTATVDNLPTVVDGQPAVYSWKEQGVLGYKLSEAVERNGVMIFYNATWKRPDNPGTGKTPKTPGNPVETLPEYDTPLGMDVMINHVGDCYD